MAWHGIERKITTFGPIVVLIPLSSRPRCESIRIGWVSIRVSPQWRGLSVRSARAYATRTEVDHTVYLGL